MAKTPVTLDGEIWRDVPGFDGEIQASNLGRVRRITVYSPVKTWFGHTKITLRRNGKILQPKIHQLVCRAFHGEAPELGLVVAHLNGVPDDNRPENLKWATHKENIGHMVEHGTALRGEQNGNAVITEEIVAQIRSRPLTKGEKDALGAKLGITRGHINDIIKRRCWRHLP